MKKIILLLLTCGFAYHVNAQTATQLLGKWKLVKWTTIAGSNKTFPDSTYQVFKEEGKFISISNGKEHNGKWKLSTDNTTLTIRSGILAVEFKIDHIDDKTRVITSDKVGTLEYEKVE